MKGPLAGIKVVELGSMVAVPKAARILADWGAEVIKVEPIKGEAWRVMGRAWKVPYDPDCNVLFQNENANKKSLALDLKTEQGKTVMKKLLSTADIFITNNRMKALIPLGLDYESTIKINPKLVFCSFSGYGENGPDKDRAGLDVASFWARSGMLVEWTYAGDTPFRPLPGVGDGASSYALVGGILAALHQRDTVGKGDKVSSSLLTVGLFANSSGIVLGQPQYGQKYPKSKFDQPYPTSPLYKTADQDWVLVSEPNWNGRYADIMRMLKLDHFIGDPRFSTVQATWENMKFIVGEMEEAFAKMTTEEATDGLTELDIAHEVLRNPNDVYKDEQAWANDYLREITLENGHKTVMPTSPIQFESVPEREFNLAPQLGADSVDVLKDIGYSDAEIEAMHAENIVLVK